MVITNQAEFDAGIAALRTYICRTIALAVMDKSGEDAADIAEYILIYTVKKIIERRPPTAAYEIERFIKGISAEVMATITAMSAHQDDGAPRLAN